MLGANPLESNGSLMTAPDLPGRLEAIQARGRPGRRRRPAAHAHGGAGRRAPPDPARHRRACCAGSPTCCSPRTWSIRRALGGLVDGLDEVEAAGRRLHARGASRRSRGIAGRHDPPLARELAAAPTRGGLRPHRHLHARRSARSRWLVDVLNVLTGNLDRPGGAMFPHAGPRARRGGPAAGVHDRALAQPRARAAGDRSASCRSRRWPTRSRRRARARSAR